MAVADKTVTNSITKNAANDEIYSTTVPAGELWYIESLHLYTDASGSDTSFGINMGAGPSEYFTAAGVTDYGSVPRGGRTNRVDCSVIDSTSVAVDAYVSGGEDIRIGEDNDDASDGTCVYYALVMRRIL